jgi:hypothetical protein
MMLFDANRPPHPSFRGIPHPFVGGWTMSRWNLTVLSLAGMALVAGAIVFAEPPKDAKPVLELKLPPGWTAADLQACIAAGTPGKMHEFLAKGAGVWLGKTTMWMGPGVDPMKSECTATVTPIMDGRYVKVEMAGEFPGMGPYTGVGTYGFDNVSQQFVSSWIDNHNTGIMTGKGELSKGGKTLTWSYTHNCPITKQPAVLREIETFTSPTQKTIETFGADPKSGQEFQMMRIDLAKK